MTVTVSSRENDDTIGEHGKALESSHVSSLSTDPVWSKDIGEPELEFHDDFPGYYRWVMLTLILVATAALGPVFMNAPPLRDLFSEAGAYNSLCDPATATLGKVAGILNCPAKDTANENLAPFAVSVLFSFTFIAGILLDCFGSKLCSCFGILSTLTGWVLLAFSGPTFNGFKAAVFFLAAGADPLIFGFLSIGNLFPGYTSTVMALIGTARSVAFAIPIVLYALFSQAGWSLQAVSLAMAGVVVAGFVVIVLTLPWRPYPRSDRIPKKLRGAGDAPETAVAASLKEYVRRRQSYAPAALREILAQQFVGWTKHMLTLGYAAFLLIAICTLIRNNSYVQTSRRHFPESEDFYTIMSPLSFIPCPIMGLIADKIAASICIFILQITGFISMILAMTAYAFFHKVSIIFNWVFISFVASQFYCYSAAVYPQNQMGKLAGFPLLVAGLVSLSSEAMNNFASQGVQQLLAMDVLTVCFSAAASGLAVFLYLRVERPFQQEAKAKAEQPAAGPAESV